MSDYTKIVDFAAKDALITGNPVKLVKGTEIGAELDAISTAIATKHDAADIGVIIQAYDADLATWAGVTPGTGVATALAVNVGSAGSPVVNGGALGTPSSGTVTNLTGTASININGTVGATTPAAGAFTTLSATGVTTVQAGTVLLPAIIPSGDPNTGMWFPAADTVAVSTGGSEKLRIDSSGNVGIGTTPASILRLHVKGSDTTSSNYAAAFQDSGGNNIVLFRNDHVTNFYGETTVIQPVGLGYGTGAGGTAAQGSGSGKATAVTLNKPTGLITLDTALLGAGGSVSFDLNNSLIAAADVLLLNVRKGTGTVAAYDIKQELSAGVATITIKNTTGGSLSEGFQINFAIIKGATS